MRFRKFNVLENILAFIATSLLIIVVPGPDLMLILKNTSKGGFKYAFWTIVGILTGIALLATLAAAGLTVVVKTLPSVYSLIKFAGALYLVYLGISALFEYIKLRKIVPIHVGKKSSEHSVQIQNKYVFSNLRQGFLCNVLNPKVAVFYLALFPQFDLSPVPHEIQKWIMAFLFWLLCFIWYALLLTVLAKLSPLFSSATFARRTELVAGIALSALGFFVLFG